MAGSVNCGYALWLDGGTYNGLLGRTFHVAASFLNTGNAQVRGGIMPSGGAMAVSAGSGLSVNVASGYALCASSAGSTSGGYLFGLMTAANLTLATADPTNPRIDIVVAYVDDVGTSSSFAAVEVVTGTPAPSPSAPTPPSNSVTLAQIAVAANATSITAGNITDERVYTTAVGGLLPVSAAAAAPTGYTGHYIHDLTTGRLLHNPSAGPVQPHLLPFAPQIAFTTTTVDGTGGETQVLAITVTCDGVTDIEIISSWNGLYCSASATQKWYIDATQIDGSHHYANSNSTADQGGSKYYRTSSVLSSTPSAGSHTIKWTVDDGHLSAGAAYPATMHVRPLSL